LVLQLLGDIFTIPQGLKSQYRYRLMIVSINISSKIDHTSNSPIWPIVVF